MGGQAGAEPGTVEGSGFTLPGQAARGSPGFSYRLLRSWRPSRDCFWALCSPEAREALGNSDLGNR